MNVYLVPEESELLYAAICAAYFQNASSVWVPGVCRVVML